MEVQVLDEPRTGKSRTRNVLADAHLKVLVASSVCQGQRYGVRERCARRVRVDAHLRRRLAGALRRDVVDGGASKSEVDVVLGAGLLVAKLTRLSVD